MKTIINCFKLLKYSSQLKTQLIFSVVIGVIGFTFEFTSVGNSALGGFYLFLLPVMFGQMLMTLSFSNLVQSSPLKKKLQTVLPYVISTPFISLALLVVILHRFYLIQAGIAGISAAENYANQSVYIAQLGVMVFFSLIYFAFCYKFFLLSTIIFMGVMIPSMIVFSGPFSIFSSIFGKSFGMSVIVTIILFIAGSLLSFLVSNLCYKLNLSPYIIKRTLGKMAG